MLQRRTSPFVSTLQLLYYYCYYRIVHAILVFNVQKCTNIRFSFASFVRAVISFDGQKLIFNFPLKLSVQIAAGAETAKNIIM